MSTGSDTALSAVPLCDSMARFRDAFVAVCDSPNEETKAKLADALLEVEQVAHELRGKVTAH